MSAYQKVDHPDAEHFHQVGTPGGDQPGQGIGHPADPQF